MKANGLMTRPKGWVSSKPWMEPFTRESGTMMSSTEKALKLGMTKADMRATITKGRSRAKASSIGRMGLISMETSSATT